MSDNRLEINVGDTVKIISTVSYYSDGSGIIPQRERGASLTVKSVNGKGLVDFESNPGHFMLKRYLRKEVKI